MKEFIKKLIEFLSDFLKSLSKEKIKESRNYKSLQMAASQVGVVEWRNGSNPIIDEYLDWGSRVDNTDSGFDQKISWCAGFVGWSLEKAGMGSTNSLAARSYERWGKSSLNNPMPGDIAVFFRNGVENWQGHVGFFLKKNSSHVWVLGGNQSDSVNITMYSLGSRSAKWGLSDIRRSSKEYQLDAMQRESLFKLRDKILNGQNISLGESVV